MSKSTDAFPLHIAEGIHLPLELAARTQAILAQKGAGKTYTGLRFTELLLTHRQQVVAMDPTGVWWGLRAPAPGSAGRSFDVIVLGGAHGDAPLESTAGRIVAELAVNSGRSLVLDMSGFESNAAQDRFAADFLESLYRLKASVRTTLHLMVDEADSFAPQRPQPGQQRMLGAMEAIVRRGRSRGLGITMISQRPAVLNKNVLSQADLLIAQRIVGIHDHKAVGEWASLYGEADHQKQFLESLPKLDTGEAWFWSPSWLGIFKRGKVSKRVTFDSSRTPDPGESVKPPTLAHVDIDALSADIRATVERAKENDPRELKRRVAELEKENRALSQRPKDSVPPSVVKALSADLRKAEKSLMDVCLFFLGMKVEYGDLLRKLGCEHVDGRGLTVRKHEALDYFSAAPAPTIPKPAPPPSPKRPSASIAHNGDKPVSKAETAVLTVLKQYEPEPVEKNRIALIAGYAVNGGGFNNALSSLRGRRWIDGRDRLSITAEGSASIKDVPPLPTGQALLDHWIAQSSKAEAAVLQALSDTPNGSLTKAEIAEVAGYASNGGGFNNALSRLRTLKLITGRDQISLAEELRS